MAQEEHAAELDTQTKDEVCRHYALMSWTCVQ